MNAWEILKNSSTVDGVDAWTHFNNLGGGSIVDCNFMLLEEFKYNLTENSIETDVAMFMEEIDFVLEEDSLETSFEYIFYNNDEV